MACPSEHYGLCSNGTFRVVLALLATFLICYSVVGPQSNSKGNSSGQASCPCVCDCSQESAFPLDTIDRSVADCGENDPEAREEMQKDIGTLIAEEVALQKVVANETLMQKLSSVTNSRQTSLQYQKEAEKCNVQMEACEEAREKAEAEMVLERRRTDIWERRARELGWKDGKRLHK